MFPLMLYCSGCHRLRLPLPAPGEQTHCAEAGGEEERWLIEITDQNSQSSDDALIAADGPRDGFHRLKFLRLASWLLINLLLLYWVLCESADITPGHASSRLPDSFADLTLVIVSFATYP